MMSFINAECGLAIAKTKFVYLNHGAYGVVFVDKEAEKIIKVFIRSKDKDEDHVQKVFNAEVDAYCRAKLSPDVLKIIPGNFMRYEKEVKVVDGLGMDVTSGFYPNFAYSTDYVRGHFFKFSGLQGSNASNVRALFKSVGIDFTADMSVTVDDSNNILKAVDFATEEYVLSHR